MEEQYQMSYDVSQAKWRSHLHAHDKDKARNPLFRHVGGYKNYSRKLLSDHANYCERTGILRQGRGWGREEMLSWNGKRRMYQGNSTISVRN
jgi:hypothetical protein